MRVEFQNSQGFSVLGRKFRMALEEFYGTVRVAFRENQCIGHVGSTPFGTGA